MPAKQDSERKVCAGVCQAGTSSVKVPLVPPRPGPSCPIPPIHLSTPRKGFGLPRHKLPTFHISGRWTSFTNV